MKNNEKITLKEIEFQKIKLEPGDTLLLKFKGEEFLNDYNLIKNFKNAFKTVFPYNKITIITLPDNHDVELTSVKNNDNMTTSCSSASYCNNCNCGKKERLTKGQG